MADLDNMALAKTDDLPIRHDGSVHSGKVRSAYWLTQEDSSRLIQDKYGFAVNPNAQLGVLVISDRISAFECNWKGEDGLMGIPGKGAALNAISKYWFDSFAKEGLGQHHVLDVPHPLVWIVQKADPIMVEAIARQYITGSMWRDYKNGDREFCGISLPDGLNQHQRLPELLMTPSTKGVITGIPGVPEQDDVNIATQIIIDNYDKFGFRRPEDVATYERMLKCGFDLIARESAKLGYMFVDTKFEFGYAKEVPGGAGQEKECIIYMDEIGTPDSSRFWRAEPYQRGEIVEDSKEGFRQFLIAKFGDVMTDKKKWDQRVEIARDYRVPVTEMMDVSKTYTDIAEAITRSKMPKIENAKQEILDSLAGYGILN